MDADRLFMAIRPTACCAAAVTLALLIGATVPAATEDPAPSSKTARSQMYEELAREVTVLERHGNLLKKVVRLVKPTVVHIEAKKDESSATSHYHRRRMEEAGSGVVIQIDSKKDKFYVLTNRHVVNHAPLANIKISLADGRQLNPKAKWTDAGTDVAVLEIAAPELTPARIGNSRDVEIGDFVLAVGSPFGLSHSVTYGIISAKGRRNLKLGTEGVRYQEFMQTDAAINPGNSGGPLVSLRGEVIGINTAIASASGGNEGIGFTIPINMFMSIARQLIERGTVSRAFLGVHLDSQFGPEKAAELGLRHPTGSRVSGITAGSPAAAAELKANDVILEFDGIAVEDDSHLVNLVSLTEVGKEVKLVVLRDGKKRVYKVKVGDRAKFRSDE